MNITALGYGAHATLGAGGMFRWHQAEVGHEVGCRGEARRVANGRRQAGAGDRIQTAQRTQVLHQREQRPGRDLRAQKPINAIPPLFTQTHRLNTFLQHDLLRRLSKTLVGQPSSMRLGPKPSRRLDRSARDGEEMHSIVDERYAPPAPPPNGYGSDRASLRAPHPAPRPRSATRRGCKTARPLASRLSFFCRSPLLRGIIEGATTTQSSPILVRVR